MTVHMNRLPNHLKYKALLSLKIQEYFRTSSAAVVIGALKAKTETMYLRHYMKEMPLFHRQTTTVQIRLRSLNIFFHCLLKESSYIVEYTYIYI